jgi:hypothetical protein
MKKLVPLALFALAATVCVTAQQTSQSSQSLGDVARKQRAADRTEPAKKVWTDDDFSSKTVAPATDTVAPDATAKEGEKPAEATSDKGTGKVAVAADAKDKKDEKAASAGEADKINAEWKSKLDAQKAKIADLQREHDLTDREYKLSVTSYYADAGNRLRDQKDFRDKEISYRDKLGTLKQSVADEQAKLAELQEEAHKAGANKAYD